MAFRATPARAEAWFDKHNRTPPEQKTTLAAAAQFLAHQPAGTTVVAASEFYDAIPAGDSLGGGFGNSSTGWLFNNSVLTLGSKEDAVAKVAVPRQTDIGSSCAARALREAVSVSIWTPARPSGY